MFIKRIVNLCDIGYSYHPIRVDIFCIASHKGRIKMANCVTTNGHIIIWSWHSIVVKRSCLFYYKAERYVNTKLFRTKYYIVQYRFIKCHSKQAIVVERYNFKLITT